MANSVKRDFWTPCEILELRKLSEEELKEVRSSFTKVSYLKLIINSMHNHYRNIRYKDGLVISDLDTLIEIIDGLIDDDLYKKL